MILSYTETCRLYPISFPYTQYLQSNAYFYNNNIYQQISVFLSQNPNLNLNYTVIPLKSLIQGCTLYTHMYVCIRTSYIVYSEFH